MVVSTWADKDATISGRPTTAAWVLGLVVGISTSGWAIAWQQYADRSIAKALDAPLAAAEARS